MSRTRVLSVLAALVAAVLACAGFALIGAPATAAPHRASTLPPKPKPGQCRNLTSAQMNAFSNSSPATACTDPHTVYTYAVPTVPKHVKFKTTKQLEVASARLCEPRFRTFLGRTAIQREQTALAITLFVPTKAQRAAGARWVRCDVYLMGRDTVPLPTFQHPLTNPLPDSIRRCLTSDGYFTSCDRPHAHRSVAAFAAPGKKYPKRAQFIKDGDRYCPSNGNDYFSWPGEGAWKAGDHIEVCYRDTTS